MPTVGFWLLAGQEQESGDLKDSEAVTHIDFLLI